MNIKNVIFIGMIACLSLVACEKQEEQVTEPDTFMEVHNGYQATLAEGIQFAEKPDYPAFIKSVSGMSEYEKIGRWTEGKNVNFVFTQNLPTKFHLNLEFAPAFGPDQGEEVQIYVGEWKGTFVASDKPQNISFLIETAIITNSIKFVIPFPISSAELGTGEDTRSVGIMFKRLSIVTDEPNDISASVKSLESLEKVGQNLIPAPLESKVQVPIPTSVAVPPSIEIPISVVKNKSVKPANVKKISAKKDLIDKPEIKKSKREIVKK